jgi:hypothetical protein
LSIGLTALILFMTSDGPFFFVSLGCHGQKRGGIRGHNEKDRQANGQKRKGSSEAIKRRTDNPMDKRERGHQMSLGCLSFSLWPLMTPFSLVHWVVCLLYGLWWPFLFCPVREGQTTQWTKEKGVIRGHKEKDRQPNGPKRKGSSEVIKRTDNAMDKRERGHRRLSVLLFMASDDTYLFCLLGCLSFSLWHLMTPFSFVHWLVCPSSLYDLWWALSFLSIGLSAFLSFANGQKRKGTSEVIKRRTANPMDKRERGDQRP